LSKKFDAVCKSSKKTAAVSKGSKIIKKSKLHQQKKSPIVKKIKAESLSMLKKALKKKLAKKKVYKIRQNNVKNVYQRQPNRKAKILA
jgi:hypothetical protein